jgi:alpha-beta hydrolase superfamily lysophospholipase
MQESTFTLAAPDGIRTFVYRWAPQSRPAAGVHIIHGLAEHAARYRRLANALTSARYAVYASDLRGHGRTAATPEDLGFFCKRDGWRKCLDDLWQVNETIAAENPATPIILLGHSMGATLARQFTAEHGDVLSGVVLSGSSGQPTPLAHCGRLIARMERLRLGPQGRSRLIRSLTFDAFNKPFAPARTKFDWLSRDPAEVDKYVADPLCGFNASLQLWIDMLDAWCGIAGSCAGVPKNLPIYIISGSHDPVSAGTKTLEPMLAQYRTTGLQVQHKFYSDARHELFNEINRDEVTADLLEWMNRVIAKIPAGQVLAEQ